MPSSYRSPIPFVSAPHRMLFFAGAGQLVLVMAWWLSDLGGRYTGAWAPATTVVPPLWAHVFLMLYGIFPFFIFGFLLTVYPRWLGGAPVARPHYVAIFALLAGGMAAFYAGLFASIPLLAGGLILQWLGWALAVLALLRVFYAAPRRGAHEKILNLALIAGMAGIAIFLYAVLNGSGQALVLARITGLWLFLVPTVFVVSHRMLPFFSSSVLVNYAMVRPPWGLAAMLACVAGHALLEALGYPRYLFVFDLPLALTALYHTVVWQFARSFQVRLLLVLHIAFLWLGVAMLLFGIQSLTLFVTGAAVLGRAPLHALGIGFVSSMLLAMASRVTLGHSGRPLVADRLTWYCFVGLGIGALLRMAAELPYAGPAPGNALNMAAAGVWLISTGLWVWRYAPMYLRRRADGKPQ